MPSEGNKAPVVLLFATLNSMSTDVVGHHEVLCVWRQISTLQFVEAKVPDFTQCAVDLKVN